MDERDVKALMTLQVVAATGGFAAAARELHSTRAAISRIVGEAEQRIGVRLCLRTTRTVTLTDAARALLQAAGPHLLALRAAWSALPDHADELRGLVRVSSSHAFGRHHLLPVVASFRQEHPEVHFEVRLNDAIDDLVVGGFDVALRIGELPDSSLVARRLGRIPVAMVGSPELLGRTRPKSIKDLERWPAIAFRPPGSGHRRGWTLAGVDGAVTQFAVRTSPFEVDSVEAVVDLARAGAGVALVPRYLVVEDLRERRLAEVLPKSSFRGPEVHVCFAHRDLVPPRVRRFVDALVQAVRPTLT